MSPEMLKICMAFLDSIRTSQPMDWSPFVSMVQKKKRLADFANDGKFEFQGI